MSAREHPDPGTQFTPLHASSQVASRSFPVLLEEYVTSSPWSFPFLSLFLDLNEESEGSKEKQSPE